MAILFLKGTSASYHAPGFTPQSDVFYYLTDEPSFWLGNMKLSNAEDVAAAVQSIAKNAADITAINAQLAKLENDESTDGSIRNIVRSYIDAELSSTSTNAVQNKVVTAELAKKVESTIENANGSRALIFNETDGGGAKFEHSDGVWSYVGVNGDDGHGITGQLYTVDHGNGNLGTRLNMTLNGFYYTKNKNNATFEASDELATIRDVESASGSAASKTVYLVDTSAGQSDYAKQYKLYQGADASDMSNNNLIGSINIPLDKVLKNSSIVTITFSDGKLYDGMVDVTDLIVPVGTPTEADAGKYLKMEMQNVDNPLYVSVQEFSDIYTAAAGAAQVQLTIDEHNVISAALVPGSVGTTELADGAVTNAKLSQDLQNIIANKTDYVINGASGRSLIFNESDGGGAKFEHNDKTWSFVGVNNAGASGLAAQIYAVNSVDKVGSRINVSTDGIYYTSGKANPTYTADDEISTVGYVDAQIEANQLVWGTF